MTDAVLLAVILGASALGAASGLVQAVRTRTDGVTVAAVAVLMACGAAGAVAA